MSKTPQNPLQQIKKISASIEEALEDDTKLANLRAYWEIGRLATAYKKSSGLRFKDIADETAITPQNLQNYSKFYREFPKGYPERYHNRVITWSVYRCLLPVSDAKARDFYLQESCQRRWNKYDLIKHVKEDYYHQQQARGTQTKKTQSYTLAATNQHLYTYAAEVIKVIDGDTLDLDILVGFKLRLEHRVRLRGINCPEMSSSKGQKAKAFVEDELNACMVEANPAKGQFAPRPLVVIKTYKRGLYGRYIIDLFYRPGATKAEDILNDSRWLNNELIAKKLAKKI